MTDESAWLLCRRLLVARTVDERQPRRQPVVVLLGPAGSGKTKSLRAISEDCGHGVVHARFDFATASGRTEPVTTVEVLTDLARGLARKWTNRRSARFTRFALGLIAVQTELNTTDRSRAREDLRAAIDDWARIARARQTADAVEHLVQATRAMNLAPEPVVAALKLALPLLIKTVGRRPLGSASRWHADIPEAEGASPEDALIALHDLARTDPATTTSWLTQAFLADVRDSHPRMAVTEPGSPCSCDEQLQHYHTWVLLLDNLDHQGGAEFGTDLSNARQRHADQHREDYDALLVVASSGRWNADWGSDWRVPWRAAPIEPDGLATVPRCDAATYRQWAVYTSPQHVPHVYYPVLLEPLNRRETARILGTETTDPRCELAWRATGGLPIAVHTLEPLLSGGEPVPGSQQLLGPSTVDSNAPGDEPREAEPWHDRLVQLRLHKRFSDVDIGDFVTAAPFATAPWLVPDNTPSLISAPRVGRILTELRSALWVTAPSRGGATPNYAVLHPWVAQTLVSALAARPRSSDQPDYPTQFGKLLADQRHGDEPNEDDLVRTAYCRLALGLISDVVEFFTACFDRGPHQEWIDRLRLVARAPGDLPHDRLSAELFAGLVNSDTQHTPERSDVRNMVARLLAGLWLAKNPFTAPDPEQCRAIANEYQRLAGKSHRADVAALDTAAADASRGLL